MNTVKCLVTEMSSMLNKVDATAGVGLVNKLVTDGYRTDWKMFTPTVQIRIMNKFITKSLQGIPDTISIRSCLTESSSLSIYMDDFKRLWMRDLIATGVFK